MKAYNKKELELMRFDLSVAEAEWKRRVGIYLNKHGDCGSCVLGAGIAVMFASRKNARPKTLVVIDAPGLQGSLPWEESVEDIVKILKDRGIEAFYHAGRMD